VRDPTTRLRAAFLMRGWTVHRRLVYTFLCTARSAVSVVADQIPRCYGKPRQVSSRQCSSLRFIKPRFAIISWLPGSQASRRLTGPIAIFPIPEIQDRDVYFHSIGHSIEEAKKADIIILGHSVWFYALDDEQVRAFNAKHGIRLFNMASAGNSSGDFIRAVSCGGISILGYG
jgi:hypothetical protein